MSSTGAEASLLSRWSARVRRRAQTEASMPLPVRVSVEPTRGGVARAAGFDQPLVTCVLALLAFGLVMVYSASVALPDNPKFSRYASTFFLTRHAMSICLALVLAFVVVQLPTAFWERWAPHVFVFSIVLLVVVLVPFIGKVVNFSLRWIPLGVVMLAFDDLRRGRILASLDPWNPAYAQGKAYQLTHSLIAFGRGEIFGQGLGSSVEKLHYLPEAHTDFLLAVIGEELGLLGVASVICAFFWLTRRIVAIGRQAIALDRVFAGLLCQGIGVWMGLQAFINMGVNLGVLPTKGLTLPLMSYGGSAILMNLLALAIVLRVDMENRTLMRGGRV